MVKLHELPLGLGEVLVTNVWRVHPFPFLSLEFLGAGLACLGHADGHPFPIELVDSEDAFAAIATSVGNHIDVFRIGCGIDLILVPANRLPWRSQTT